MDKPRDATDGEREAVLFVIRDLRARIKRSPGLANDLPLSDRGMAVIEEALVSETRAIDRDAIIEECAKKATQWTAYDDGKNHIRREAAQDSALYVRQLLGTTPSATRANDGEDCEPYMKEPYKYFYEKPDDKHGDFIRAVRTSALTGKASDIGQSQLLLLCDLAEQLGEAQRDLKGMDEENTRLLNELDAAPSATLPTVWSVENKTSRVLFSTEEGAHSYVACFSPAVGGGMFITEVPVIQGLAEYVHGEVKP